MTKQIPLGGKYGQGKFALVDDEDYEQLSIYSWYISHGYVISNRTIRGKKVSFRMHRVVLGLPPGRNPVPDHIDRNKLNNQKSNLRIATHKENSRYSHAKHTNKTSKYKGVLWSKKDGLWQGRITVDGKSISCGIYATQREAAIAYNEFAIKYFGEFALLNEIQSTPDPDDEPVIRKVKPGQTSGYKGVICNGRTWGAHFGYKGKMYHIGYFPTPEQAAKAYDAAVMKYIGHKGKFNFPDSVDDLPNIDLPVALSANDDKKTRKSGFRGVSLHADGRWTMRIFYQGKRIQEYFDSKVDAAKAYDKYAKLRGGKVIYLNFPNATNSD